MLGFVEAINGLKDTPIPNVLIGAGVLFLFIAIGGQVAARGKPISYNQKAAGGFGIFLLLLGVALHLLPLVLPDAGETGEGTETPAADVTPSEKAEDETAIDVSTETALAPTFTPTPDLSAIAGSYDVENVCTFDFSELASYTQKTGQGGVKVYDLSESRYPSGVVIGSGASAVYEGSALKPPGESGVIFYIELEDTPGVLELEDGLFYIVRPAIAEDFLHLYLWRLGDCEGKNYEPVSLP